MLIAELNLFGVPRTLLAMHDPVSKHQTLTLTRLLKLGYHDGHVWQLIGFAIIVT